MTTVRGNAHGVADWASRDPWRARMGLLMDKHLRKACDLNDLAIEDLAEVIGPLAMTALDCVFEDLCTTVWEDGANLAGDYLKRRGWKETAMNRAYIEALRGSVLSLYEVSDVRLGESFLARDLVRGGEPIRVIERTATKTLVAWDVIAARIVTVRGKVQLTSVVLDVGREVAGEMLDLLGRTRDRAPAVAADLFGAADPELRARLAAALASESEILSVAAPMITTLWLNDAIRRCLAPLPELANTDGDPLEFMTLHYRIDPGGVAGVAAALAEVPDLCAEADGAHWTLFAPEAPTPKSGRRKRALDPNAGRTVHASLGLENGVLKVLVNSEARAARVRFLIDPALAGLAREPLVERVTPEQAMAEAGEAGAQVPHAALEDVDPAELRAVVHEVLDRHYRKTLGEPVPMLGGKSPRQAARSAQGRQAVANWLKGLEQTSARRAGDDPMRDYDFSWMWKELNVADLRS